MKIAVILSHVPYPLDKGEQLRAFNQLKILARTHEIHIFSLSEKSISPQTLEILSSFVADIHVFNLNKFSIVFNSIKAFFGKLPLSCGHFFNARIKKQMNRKIDELKPDVIYNQLILTAAYTKDRNEKKILDYQNVFSKDIFRLMEKTTNKFKRWFYQIEYKRLQQYENEIFKYFDYKTIITQVDRDLIQHHLSEQIVVVPNGVDLNYFQSKNTEKQYDIIFTGNMSHLPNVFACEYIVKEILPQLILKYPHIQIVLCGVNPSARVLSLSNSHVKVTGWVDDIRSYYDKSKIFLAPMQIGSGLQNKLLEAMAMKVPCITSPLASNPLKANNNQELLICNSVLGYIDAIENLLNNKDLYEKIASNGYEFVKKNYNWESTTLILNELITS